ncbi:MAG: energy-coupling factor transporter transmembrane protein EcfT [Clostridiales Family XIII bacterium]|jgi:energy-coupling factor transport system permease protein|nr:energy-coupling factor transporter transmembrane protein EcfT [Clostridiales Family XIII bacterium]
MSESRLSRLDPRTKFVFAVSVSGLCFFTEDILLLAALLLAVVVLLAIGGVNAGAALRRCRPLVIIIASLFVIQSLFSAGRGMDGVLLAAALSLRLLLITASAQALLEGEIRDYMLALVQMKVPYEIAFMVTTGLHFLPVLRDEAMNVYWCVQLRGRAFRKVSLPAKIRAYMSICLPILVNTLRRAEEMSVAMELRGLRAKPGRTYMRRVKMRAVDFAAAVLWLAAVAGIYYCFDVFDVFDVFVKF